MPKQLKIDNKDFCLQRKQFVKDYIYYSSTNKVYHANKNEELFFNNCNQEGKYQFIIFENGNDYLVDINFDTEEIFCKIIDKIE